MLNAGDCVRVTMDDSPYKINELLCISMFVAVCAAMMTSDTHLAWPAPAEGPRTEPRSPLQQHQALHVVTFLCRVDHPV